MTYACKYPQKFFLLNEFFYKYFYLIDWIKTSILDPGPAFELEKLKRNKIFSCRYNQNLTFFNYTLLFEN